MIAAIHQPNFFPWLGFFRKLALADVFVFLDATPVPRSSRGGWQNRTRLLANGHPVWLTCPVAKTDGEALSLDLRMAGEGAWRDKLLRTLEHHYARTPHYREFLPRVRDMVLRDTDRLAEYNEANIRELAGILGLSPRFVRQSELDEPDAFQAKGSRRLAAICRAVGADTYLAGDGSQGYEDPQAYADRGVALRYSGFRPEPYPQAGATEFTPGLSVLDALFNVGAGASSLLGIDR